MSTTAKPSSAPPKSSSPSTLTDTQKLFEAAKLGLLQPKPKGLLVRPPRPRTGK